MSVIASSALSDTGRKRRRNEDAFVCEPPLFAVADGMGGAQAGEIASQLAAESIADQEICDLPSLARVVELIRAANRRVYAYSSENPSARGMGTTMTVALVAGDTVVVGHVGDSRAYLLREGRLEQLTEDHSLVAELVRSGRLSPEEAEIHPQRSVITRALGTDPEVDVDAFSIPVKDRDLFLLCSDGLTSMVANDEIERVLNETRNDLDRSARELIRAANRAGGEDNITVVLFEVEVPDREGTEFDKAETLTEADAVPVIHELPTTRNRRRIVFVGMALVLVVAVVALFAYVTSSAYFIGAEPDGHIAIYQGLPYELPGGISLYRTVRVSGRLFAFQLTASERRHLFDHSLHSYNACVRELNRYEEVVYP